MGNNDFNKRCGYRMSGGYFIAILLIVAGLLILGRNTGILPHSVYHVILSWPMLIIAVGVYTLLQREVTGGLIVIAVGTYFLLPRIDLFHATLSSMFWPVVLITIGLVTLFRLRRRNTWAHSNHHYGTDAHQYVSSDGYISSDNTFSSVRHIVSEEVFKGGFIRNKFGATVIDLRRSTLAAENTYLDIDCKFGGIELYIPATWTVRLEFTPVLGGCDDTRIPVANMDTQHVLVLRGSISFSGLEIKS